MKKKLKNTFPNLYSFARNVKAQRQYFGRLKIIRSTAKWVESESLAKGWHSRRRGPWYKQHFPSTIRIFDQAAKFVPGSTLPSILKNPEARTIISWVVQEAGLLALQEAFVFSQDGIVLNGDNEVFDEFSPGVGEPSCMFSRFANHFTTWSSQINKIEEPAAVLAAPGYDSYYHWLLQILPRIHLLQSVQPLLEHYIIPKNAGEKFVASLKTLGIDEKHLYPIGHGEKVQCSQLFVPSIPSNEGAIPHWVIDFLRRQFLDESYAPERKKKLYVVRGNRRRRVLNEDLVVSAVSKLGFEPVAGENLSVSQQARIFSEASMIIGAHGAGLTNIVFAEGAKVVEIFRPSVMPLNCYFPLSVVSNNKYWGMISEGDESDCGDVIINIDQLIRTIEFVESQ